MKKLRPFLALLLACWLLVLPALADDETGGDTGESSSVSDSVEDDNSSSSEETPPEETPPSETAPPEESPPASTENPPPPENPPPEETPPPVTEDPPPVTVPDPVDPPPEDLEPDLPIDPTDPNLPVDPLPENPDTPVDPLPENPDIPVTPPAVDPNAPVEVPPSYVIPNTPLVPGTLNVPTQSAPAAEEHEVFTVTTIPEFARTTMEFYSGSTMSSVVRDLFGTYTPKVQTVSTYVDGELVSAEEQYVPGVAGMDWEWIAGFAVFLLILYCLFRLLGGSVKYG